MNCVLTIASRLRKLGIVKQDLGVESCADQNSDELFSKINRTTLTNKSGITFGQVRKGLLPRYGIVWRDLILGWVGLAVIIWATIAMSHQSRGFALVAAVVGAVLLGFTIAYIMLFLHEAAHYNVHPDHRWNDLLCNFFISGIVGVDVQNYRQIHWDHHRHFGGPMDTEISYRDPLDLRFLVETLFGVRAMRVILLRREKLRSIKVEKPADPRLKTGPYAVLAGMALNATCLGVLFYLHEWAAMFSWICGVLVFFPFFGALRQLLEHRAGFPAGMESRAEIVYFATNRIFGDGLLASTFGAAGFNRHLLHHWDPQISYTRLRELESFLLDTQAEPYLRERQTSYWRTFGELFSYVRR